MIRVLFQLPRNNRIITAVRIAAISASRSTPSIAARTNSDWSNNWLSLSPSGYEDSLYFSIAFRLSTICSVDALPVCQYRVGLWRKSVADVRDILHIDRCAVHRFHRQIIQLGHGLGAAVH